MTSAVHDAATGDGPPPTDIHAEAMRLSLVAKAAATESCFLLTAQLKRLDPHQIDYYIHDVLAAFYAVDVTLHGRVLDWLVESLGFDEGQRIMARALATWKSLPFDFEETKTHGIMVVCRSLTGGNDDGTERGKDEDDDEGGGGDDDDTEPQRQKKQQFITEVPASSDSQPFINGTVLATVREGDSLQLKSPSSKWWLVFEMRRSKGTLLLSSVSGGKSAVVEYREVRIASLMGCLVRREGVLSARTIAKMQREGSHAFVDYSQCLLCRPEDGEAEGYTGTDPYDGPGCRRIALLFRMPGPDLRGALARMRVLVDEFPLPSADEQRSSSSLSSSRERLEPLQHMQSQAQAKAYVQRWEEAQRARQLLARADPFACVLSRDKWLLVLRALRTISRGSKELLRDFAKFTAQAGREGLLRSKDVGAAWESLRPTTNADLPALAQARAFLKMRGAGRDDAFFDEQGKLRPEVMKAVDPLAKGILEAASTYLADRSLFFFQQRLQGMTKVAAKAALNIEAAAAQIPAATYEHYVLDDEVVRTGYLGEVGGDQQEEHVKEGIRAYLTAGDVIHVRTSFNAGGRGGGGSGDGSGSCAGSTTWMQVLSIDLLFSRLRVVPCVEPPRCWYPHSTQNKQAAALWLPLSRLWGVTVCRLLPPQVEVEEKQQLPGFHGRHLIFVLPAPAPAEALAVLAALDRRTASTPHTVGQGDMATTTKGPLSLAVAEVKQQKLFAIAALSYFSDAVIVGWTALASHIASYTLEVAHVSAPYNWRSVYSGKGLGCQICGLEPLSQYYCRVTANIIAATPSVKPRKAQTLITTLGAPLACSPTVVEWESTATTSGSARGHVVIYDESTTWAQPLPAECFYQVEASLPENGKQSSSESWQAVGRTRALRLWIVGAFSGRTILLRTRIVNQLGQPGTASPIALIQVPEIPLGRSTKGGGAKKRGSDHDVKNESCVSELTML